MEWRPYWLYVKTSGYGPVRWVKERREREGNGKERGVGEGEEGERG